ncbi:reverse transcriptase domain-containing protein [Tanacetum coccineum]
MIFDLRLSNSSHQPSSPFKGPASSDTRLCKKGFEDMFTANDASVEKLAKTKHRRRKPPVVQIQSRNPNPEPNVAPVVTPVPKASIPFPSRRNDERRKEKANDQIEKFYEIFRDLSFEISFTDALMLMPKFASTFKNLFVCLIDVYEGEITLRVGKEAITFNLDQTSKYTADYNHMMVNKIDVIDMACDEYSQEDPEGDILLLEAILNSEPPPPLPNQEQYLPGVRKELKLYEAKIVESSVDEPPEVELKELPPHLEYVFLEGDDKLPVIIVKDLKDEETEALSQVLKSHSEALWKKLSDIKGVSPEFYLGEPDGRVCIDYRKLNEATRKDHFPLPFMDQMLERLAGNEYYCFLDGFSGYFQIPIDPKDQEKTTFTCPYGTFAYRRMPFGLCNAPGTFQRCMMAIFHDMIEKTMEVFMDDFSVFGDSFSTCLTHLEKMLKRCEDTNLSLNWEKSHFMVKEGIVLGHKISKSGLEVDRAKVEVIAKLPHPTSVKGVRSFLGHAGFYRRFIQDFSKIARPMTHLLEKETPFVFSEECVDSFNTLKRRLTEAPILIAPDWDLPFELMCDASDFAIGAVLGQRKNKHFQPIHYASKTMNEAQTHYTTTEKELLAVVYAFEKFRSYLVMSKSIVYTDHSAIIPHFHAPKSEQT